jgi:hypothetical protein
VNVLDLTKPFVPLEGSELARATALVDEATKGRTFRSMLEGLDPFRLRWDMRQEVSRWIKERRTA